MFQILSFFLFFLPYPQILPLWTCCFNYESSPCCYLSYQPRAAQLPAVSLHCTLHLHLHVRGLGTCAHTHTPACKGCEVRREQRTGTRTRRLHTEHLLTLCLISCRPTSFGAPLLCPPAFLLRGSSCWKNSNVYYADELGPL